MNAEWTQRPICIDSVLVLNHSELKGQLPSDEMVIRESPFVYVIV